MRRKNEIRKEHFYWIANSGLAQLMKDENFVLFLKGLKLPTMVASAVKEFDKVVAKILNKDFNIVRIPEKSTAESVI